MSSPPQNVVEHAPVRVDKGAMLSKSAAHPTSTPQAPPSWREREFLWLGGIALMVIAAWIAHAAARWWNFQFTTFDLAFYVQVLWNMLRGSTYSTLLDLPMLGNHADVIVFLLVPVFALVPHALTPTVVQILVCAATAPLGYRAARVAGLAPRGALLLALTLLLTPAMQYAATFEFHPEALTGFFILLVYYGELRRKPWVFWLGVVATLSCKENMALLLFAYACVQGALLLWKSRGKPTAALLPYALLLALCMGWFFGYEKLVRPAMMDTAQVDYHSLYDHLGGSLVAVALSPLRDPGAFWAAITQSLSGGNLLWATLLPLAFLPLLRPQWIIIAGPILAQHLLSNRSSEWGVTHHYAVPLLPLWFAAALEAILWLQRVRPWRRFQPAQHLPWVCAGLTLLTLCLEGLPFKTWALHTHGWVPGRLTVETRHELLREIPPEARLFIGPPYLSHVAQREGLYSLQLLTKGSLTLSTQPYIPPEDANLMVVDYLDVSIFSLIAGFYHGPLRYPDGLEIESSDIIMHRVLRNGNWITETSLNEWSSYRRLPPGEELPAGMHLPRDPASTEGAEVTEGTTLKFAEPRRREVARGDKLQVGMLWDFVGDRELIPWMWVRFEPLDAATRSPGPARPGAPRGFIITRGLALPQGFDNGQLWRDVWEIDPSVWPIPPGRYRLTLGFQDQATVVALARTTEPGVRPEFERALLAEIGIGEVVLR